MIKYPLNTNFNNFKVKDETFISKFGLPRDVKFCKRCVISNQRPNSEVEYLHTENTKKKTIKFHDDGICDACKVNEKKEKNIDWDSRHSELMKLCDQYRSNNGYYDCIVPGSGGKDSFYAAHILKYKYKMNPLTVTWAPNITTPWGIKNMENWINSGFDNYYISPNRKVQRLLVRLATENLFHPFQSFQFGQKICAPRLAKKLNIKLIFYGENQAEYGNSSNDLETSLMNDKFFTTEEIKDDEIFISGVSVQDLKTKFGLTGNDLYNYMPIKKAELQNSDIKVYYLSHYLKWHPQSNYYYAVKHGNFVTSDERMPGTYTKFISVDDKMEYFNYYTLGIKYGLGWTSNIASVEVRDGDITRDEAVALVKKYDVEYPKKFIKEFCEYLTVKEGELPEAYKMFEKPEFDEQYLLDLQNKFRSPHIWKYENNEWKLRKTVYQDRSQSNYQEMHSDTNSWEGNKKQYNI